ncbi:hypothetical protein STEG23_014837, partial [Scotinomys teguina]
MVRPVQAVKHMGFGGPDDPRGLIEGNWQREQASSVIRMCTEKQEPPGDPADVLARPEGLFTTYLSRTAALSSQNTELTQPILEPSLDPFQNVLLIKQPQSLPFVSSNGRKQPLTSMNPPSASPEGYQPNHMDLVLALPRLQAGAMGQLRMKNAIPWPHKDSGLLDLGHTLIYHDLVLTE